MLPQDTDIFEFLLKLKPPDWPCAVRSLGFTDADGFDRDWPTWAHEGQREPPGDWSTWVIKGGRGFGKTLAGSHWIAAAVAGGEKLSIALVGATLEETRRVMVERRGGLLDVAGPWIREWHPNLRTLRFRTGAEATIFSGASPDQLRGAEHHLAWCDELAKWEKPGETWDMLQFGLRCGARPRALVTTTPRPGPVLKAIMALPGTIVTGGPSSANPHNSPAWLADMQARYAGTRLGRQELEGELLGDTPGALWTVELLERCRILPGTGRGTAAEGGGGGGAVPCAAPPPSALRAATSPSRGGYVRLVIAVDPPTGDGTCGIIACARDEAGTAHVLADHSVTGLSPEGWSRAVADAAGVWGHLCTSVPIQIVAEQNQGGRMVETILRIADPDLDVKLVTAIPGKTVRAEPVARLFEAGQVLLHGRFPALEAQLCGLIAGGDYEGPGTSPDRADAMVWALTELMLGVQYEPRIRAL